MSDSDQNRHAPGQLGSAVWSLAALSVAVFLCSVLAAKLIGDMVESGMTEIAAAVSAAAPARKGSWGVIDPVATGSIHPNGGSGGVAKARDERAK